MENTFLKLKCPLELSKPSELSDPREGGFSNTIIIHILDFKRFKPKILQSFQFFLFFFRNSLLQCKCDSKIMDSSCEKTFGNVFERSHCSSADYGHKEFAKFSHCCGCNQFFPTLFMHHLPISGMYIQFCLVFLSL